VDRMACIDLPSFPLQLLLLRQPGWSDVPAAVVEHDRPQGRILWLNRHARRRRIRPGMRYATALALAEDLRAGEVSAEEIERGVARTADRLSRFSPRIEPAPDEPGVFWLDASGLERLYGSVQAWAEAVHHDLDAADLRATVVVGWSRFGSYAVAKVGAVPGARKGTAHGRPGVVVFDDVAEERQAAQRVPLAALGIAPSLRDALERLGIQTVAGLLRLPAQGLRERFGDQAHHRLHRLAAGELWAPLQPRALPEPPRGRIELGYPETDLTRLLFQLKPTLDALLRTLAEHRRALAELQLDLQLDRGGVRSERIRLAAPGLAPRPILNLVYLRLEGFPLTAGVVAVELSARTVAASREQLQLFHHQQRRDLEAADQALARMRAEFGEQSVVYARLEDGHLPEAAFSWQPVSQARYPQPRETAERLLVRRVFTRPIRLPPRPRREPDGWLLLGAGHGHVVETLGPYVVSGGWWMRRVRRDYYFAQTRDGELLWIYFDKRRQRWYLHGRVE